MSAHPTKREDESQGYLHALWPEHSSVPGELAIFSTALKGTVKWTTISSAAGHIAQLSSFQNVYITVQIHDRELSAKQWMAKNPGKGAPKDHQHRGCAESATAIPGFWLDFDCREGEHREKQLPSKEEALQFLRDSELEPTLIVDTGGGYHAYWLFKEAWVFTSDEERREAQGLGDRFEACIRHLMQDLGWKLDPVSDFARVLRVPGTFNVKNPQDPKQVTIHSYDDAYRCNPADILAFIERHPFADPEDDTACDVRPDLRELPSADLIYKGCEWLRSQKENPAAQTEPAWLAGVSIVGRTEDGAEEAHRFSEGHPAYTRDDTARKLKHALEGAGPWKCSTIREKLGTDAICTGCVHWGRITSPIELGYPDPIDLATTTIEDAIRDGSKETLLKEEVLRAVKALKFRAPVVFAQMEQEIKVACRKAGVALNTFKKAYKSVALPTRSRVADTHRVTAAEYLSRDGCLWWVKSPEGDATEYCLTNFHARIIEHCKTVGGIEEAQFLVIESFYEGQTKTFRIPLSDFKKMDWPVQCISPTAQICPGSSLKGRAEAAIKAISGGFSESRQFVATGWYDKGGSSYFVHAGGAIDAEGVRPHIHAVLPEALSNFEFAKIGDIEDIRLGFIAIRELLAIAPLRITAPLVAFVFRTTLAQVDFSLHLFGATGVFKTQLAALAQQFFGERMTSDALPANWSSTKNALEATAYHAKDALLVVDDLLYKGSQMEVAQLREKVETLLRGQGNHAGRQRMRPDTTLIPAMHPRGGVLSTGEECIPGQSLAARVLMMEVRKADVNIDRLTAVQGYASEGVFSKLNAAFIKDAARDIHSIRGRMQAEKQELRSKAGARVHARVSGIELDLLLGSNYITKWLINSGAVSATEGEELRLKLHQGIKEAMFESEQRLADANPVVRFLELLSSSLKSGRYFLEVDGNQETTTPHVSLKANAPKIGYLIGDQVLLLSQAAFAATQELARSQGNIMSETLDNLQGRLVEAGLLVAKERRRGAYSYTVRKTVNGRREYGWLLNAASIFGADEENSV
jgi:hypothetical protein